MTVAGIGADSELWPAVVRRRPPGGVNLQFVDVAVEKHPADVSRAGNPGDGRIACSPTRTSPSPMTLLPNRDVVDDDLAVVEDGHRVFVRARH